MLLLLAKPTSKQALKPEMIFTFSLEYWKKEKCFYICSVLFV